MKAPAQLWQHIRANTLEKALFVLAVIAFVLLVVAEIRWPAWEILPKWLITLLTHNALKSIVSSVSASVVAAYVFYLFVELVPRIKRRNETLRYLDTLLLVVLDAFHDKSIRPNPFLSVSIPIAQSYKSGLTIDYVIALEHQLLHQDGKNHSGKRLNPFEQLAEAAYARLPILRFATSMANGLSFHQGLIWSDIIETFRQISLESANTLAPMNNDERRWNLLVAATIPLLKDWLRAR